MVLSADGNIIYFLGTISSNIAICRFYLNNNTANYMEVADSYYYSGAVNTDLSGKLYAIYPNNNRDARTFMKLNPDTGISDWHVQYA